MLEGTTIPMPATFDEVFIDAQVECFSWSKWSKDNTEKEMTVGTVIFSEFFCSLQLGVKTKVNFSFKNINNTVIVAKDVKFMHPNGSDHYALSEIQPGESYQYTASSVESNPPGLY